METVVTLASVAANNSVNVSADMTDQCLTERKWHVFVASSLVTFLAGLATLLAVRLFRQLTALCACSTDANSTEHSRDTVGCWTRLKWRAEECISGQTTVGKIMVSCSCLFSVGSLIIYFIDASDATTSNAEEKCVPWNENVLQKIDLAFNVFFLFYFLIRLVAATDKLSYWLELHSLVDYFTIPPVFVSMFTGRQWLGLRFLRALRLIHFPDILQYLSILRTSNAIRLAQLIFIFVSVWLAAAGLVHLLEISGDPFFDFKNSQRLSYWECVYFILVTMATVGYGDITCQTTLGRGFMVFFILGALAMFASFIPEMAEILGRHQRYRGVYEKPIGVRHIVICGHIVYESVQNFLRDFLHEDRENQNVKCVFLDSKCPDLELEALFKRNFTKVVFFRGSIMNTRDLERVKLREAEACLVMANPRCSRPDAEDAANIMRVISIKNYDVEIRTIAQLMRYHNKCFCVNLPSWTSRDQVICLAEMKLGFMAQSCLAPGFSTLLANLFVMRSYKRSKKNLQWQEHYLRGAGMEVYTSHFSTSFYGLNFPYAVELCYTRLKLLLVAVKTADKDGEELIILNPGNEVIIDGSVKGFLICQTEDEAKRVLHYCQTCHSSVSHVDQIRSCVCQIRAKARSASGRYNASQTSHGEDRTADNKEYPLKKQLLHALEEDSYMEERETGEAERQYFLDVDHVTTTRPQSFPVPLKHDAASNHTAPLNTDYELEAFDSTGLYHWCPTRKFRDAKLSYDKNGAILKQLENHVVVCIFAEPESPLIGLCNFVMPLRASNFRFSELKKIVLVGNEQFLHREWDLIQNFPDVYVKCGSPLCRADLRYVKVNKCNMCVIVATHDSRIIDDPTLVDKEAILCSLNIKTMSFRGIADLWKSTPNKALRTLELLRRSNDGKKISLRATTGACIPMLTELANDYNVQFLDQDDEDDPDIALYMTQPFACGRAFAASLLDSLMSTTFYNEDALGLVRSLITGGSTMDFEQLLTEGLQLMQGHHNSAELSHIRDRCRVAMMPLDSSILADYSNDTYGELLVSALHNFGILCLGLYRQMDPRPSVCSFNRVVITNPPAELLLYPSDKVYCLQPYKPRRILLSPDISNMTSRV